jgi:hypothetical protein
VEINPGVGARARWAFFFGAFPQQSHNAAQALPCRLIQARIGTDEAANHIPCGDVQRPFRGQSHSKGDGALGAEADAVSCGFLPRLDAYGLREHIYGDRFVSAFKFPITAKTEKVFQAILPAAGFGLCKMLLSPCSRAGGKYVERFLGVFITDLLKMAHVEIIGEKPLENQDLL